MVNDLGDSKTQERRESMVAGKLGHAKLATKNKKFGYQPANLILGMDAGGRFLGFPPLPQFLLVRAWGRIQHTAHRAFEPFFRARFGFDVFWFRLPGRLCHHDAITTD